MARDKVSNIVRSHHVVDHVTHSGSSTELRQYGTSTVRAFSSFWSFHCYSISCPICLKLCRHVSSDYLYGCRKFCHASWKAAPVVHVQSLARDDKILYSGPTQLTLVILSKFRTVEVPYCRCSVRVHRKGVTRQMGPLTMVFA